MRIIGIILIIMSFVAWGKDVPQHFTLENPPMGWTITDNGAYKGDVSDSNSLAVMVIYREYAISMTSEEIFKDVQKVMSVKYGKTKDLGPATVASHATEGFEVTDLGGVIHHFYIITQQPNKAWMVEVRGRQTQLSAAEAEIGLILGKLKLQ
jgi:hypothetical protein